MRRLSRVGIVAFGKRALGFFRSVVAEADASIPSAAQRDARLHDVRREAVDFEIAPVHDDQPLILVEHAEALDHVAEGRIELQVLGMQLLRNAQHFHFAQLHFGDVGTGADDAAVIGAFLGNQHPAAVGQLHFQRFAGIAMPVQAARRYILPVPCH